MEGSGGKTLKFDLFEGGNNYNLIIVGESGSGKSVVINGITAAHLGRSRFNRAILVDYGGSFSGLVQALGGREFSFRDRAQIRISPIPILPELLDGSAFKHSYPGEDYQTYLENNRSLRTELWKQALVFLGFLCGQVFGRNAVFEEIFFDWLGNHARSGRDLEEVIADGISDATNMLDQNPEHIRAKALVVFRDLLFELRSKIKICPFIGSGASLDLKNRLISFNLDGFAAEDKAVLVGLITLLIQQVFSVPGVGKSLIVFDEVHKFIRGKQGGLIELLDATQRVGRKFGASLVLASQSPEDFESCPSIINNANHHIVMRLRTMNLAPVWKLVDPDILDHARNTEPADEAGFSTLHLGTTTAHGDLQGIYRYRISPMAMYAFTSKNKDKAIMSLACHLTGIGDYIALAEAVHAGQAGLVPIGSKEFWRRIQARIQAPYRPVQESLDALIGNDAYLSLFLAADRAPFETISKSRTALDRFLMKVPNCD